MNKTQKMKQAVRNTRKKNMKQIFKKIILFPWKVCKAVWRFICRVCSAIWNWLKSIDIVGMVNLTLLVAIVVLFSALIVDVVRCNGCTNSDNVNMVKANKNDVVMVANQKAVPQPVVNNRKVVKRKFSTTLPMKADPETNIKPQIKVVGVEKPMIVKETAFPAEELPQQNLAGDVIVDTFKDAPILSNGVNIDGNLFVQNMRKYTLPCGTVINGNLFIRNVDKLRFCGEFTVTGNIYVNRQSSFGPIPSDAKVGGQVIL